MGLSDQAVEWPHHDPDRWGVRLLGGPGSNRGVRRVADMARMLRDARTPSALAAQETVSRLLACIGDLRSCYLVGGLDPVPLDDGALWIKQSGGDWHWVPTARRDIPEDEGPGTWAEFDSPQLPDPADDAEWGLEGLASCLWAWAAGVASDEDLDRGFGAQIALVDDVAARIVRDAAAVVDRRIVQPIGGAWPHRAGDVWTDAERDAMLAMREAGMKDVEIASVANCSRQIVRDQIGGVREARKAAKGAALVHLVQMGKRA